MSNEHYFAHRDPDGNWVVMEGDERELEMCALLYDNAGMSEQEAKDLAWAWNAGAEDDEAARALVTQRNGKPPIWADLGFGQQIQPSFRDEPQQIINRPGESIDKNTVPGAPLATMALHHVDAVKHELQEVALNILWSMTNGGNGSGWEYPSQVIDAIRERIEALENALEAAVELFEDPNRDEVDLAWYREHVTRYLSAEAQMRLTIRRNRSRE